MKRYHKGIDLALGGNTSHKATLSNFLVEFSIFKHINESRKHSSLNSTNVCTFSNKYWPWYSLYSPFLLFRDDQRIKRCGKALGVSWWMESLGNFPSNYTQLDTLLAFPHIVPIFSTTPLAFPHIVPIFSTTRNFILVS